MRNQLQKKNGKRTNMRRLNNMLLKNQWVNDEIKEEIRKYLETNIENKLTVAKGEREGKDKLGVGD